MTIASEIQRIKDNIANTYTALEEKGATMPEVLNSNNLADTVATVTTGGGGGGATVSGQNIKAHDALAKVMNEIMKKGFTDYSYFESSNYDTFSSEHYYSLKRDYSNNLPGITSSSYYKVYGAKGYVIPKETKVIYLGYNITPWICARDYVFRVSENAIVEEVSGPTASNIQYKVTFPNDEDHFIAFVCLEYIHSELSDAAYIAESMLGMTTEQYNMTNVKGLPLLQEEVHYWFNDRAVGGLSARNFKSMVNGAYKMPKYGVYMYGEGTLSKLGRLGSSEYDSLQFLQGLLQMSTFDFLLNTDTIQHSMSQEPMFTNSDYELDANGNALSLDSSFEARSNNISIIVALALANNGKFPCIIKWDLGRGQYFSTTDTYLLFPLCSQQVARSYMMSNFTKEHPCISELDIRFKITGNPAPGYAGKTIDFRYVGNMLGFDSSYGVLSLTNESLQFLADNLSDISGTSGTHTLRFSRYDMQKMGGTSGAWATSITNKGWTIA